MIEYTFDAKVFVAITIKAETEKQAREVLRDVTTPWQSHTRSGGRSTYIGEGHQDGEAELIMIDGQDIENIEEYLDGVSLQEK